MVQAMEEKFALGKSPDLEKFLKNVEGVFFYDTPFQGIKRYKTTFFCFFYRKSSLVRNLKTLNRNIARLNGWFSEWRTPFRRTSRCRTAALFAPCATEVALWYTTTEASVRHDIDDFYTVSGSDHSNVCQPSDQTDSRYQNLVGFLKKSRLPRNSGPDPTVEDSLEDILCEVEKVRKGEGLWLSGKELENIKRFPDKWNRLVECFDERGLKMTDINSECELWTRLPADEPISEVS